MIKPRVVITGVAGFIGSNLADFLINRGYQVVGLDNLAYGMESQIPVAVEFHKIDITDIKIVNYIQPRDVIFHLAAKNCINDCQQDPVDTAFNNVYGSVCLFEAAVKKQAKKVIYAESSALYEGSTLLPTPEAEVKPESFYSVSKYSEMMFAKAYAKHYGLCTTALRYFCVYGPRQDYRRTIPPVMSAFIIKLLRKEKPIIYGTGNRRRDFIHVDDVNEFHLQCIDNEKTNGEVYNLGSGENYSVKEIYQAIAKKLNSQTQPEYKPALPGEAEITLADITKAKSLGWQPNTSLEQGLQGLINYYQETGIPWKISMS
ncbi:MAG: hypothetical protein A3E87_01960 [Gammaproteobacteria bacterium RIFCSPHIGHO2_12_FULL_35_23]|nr:MAG: hypothetical protein A3E87_01960 [Gammaproteobacteria bacterium RIFCSPHIGHO2_12_FULL_35_23]